MVAGKGILFCHGRYKDFCNNITVFLNFLGNKEGFSNHLKKK